MSSLPRMVKRIARSTRVVDQAGCLTHAGPLVVQRVIGNAGTSVGEKHHFVIAWCIAATRSSKRRLAEKSLEGRWRRGDQSPGEQTAADESGTDMSAYGNAAYYDEGNERRPRPTCKLAIGGTPGIA